MSFFYETCSVEKHFFQRIRPVCVKVCESKSVIRVGPVSAPVHVRHGVTVYVRNGVTVYIQFFTKKNLYKKI
jgi:hypothetical protein